MQALEHPANLPWQKMSLEGAFPSQPMGHQVDGNHQNQVDSDDLGCMPAAAWSTQEDATLEALEGNLRPINRLTSPVPRKWQILCLASRSRPQTGGAKRSESLIGLSQDDD